MLKQVLFLSLASAFVYALLASAKTAPKTDAQFLAMAAQADMTIAHIGKMAEERAAATKVKDLANTLVQDHTNDYQRLTQLAAKIGDSVPKAIDERNNRTIAELDRSKGKSFDRSFLTRQSLEHQKLIDAFKWEAQHGATPAIKTYANQALPTIERHLHDVEDLMKQQG